jgi:DNA-directed RNA polymerase subunit H (RpoH/RPB5)
MVIDFSLEQSLKALLSKTEIRDSCPNITVSSHVMWAKQLSAKISVCGGIVILIRDSKVSGNIKMRRLISKQPIKLQK